MVRACAPCAQAYGRGAGPVPRVLLVSEAELSLKMAPLVAPAARPMPVSVASYVLDADHSSLSVEAAPLEALAADVNAAQPSGHAARATPPDHHRHLNRSPTTVTASDVSEDLAVRLAWAAAAVVLQRCSASHLAHLAARLAGSEHSTSAGAVLLRQVSAALGQVLAAPVAAQLRELQEALTAVLKLAPPAGPLRLCLDSDDSLPWLLTAGTVHSGANGVMSAQLLLSPLLAESEHTGQNPQQSTGCAPLEALWSSAQLHSHRLQATQIAAAMAAQLAAAEAVAGEATHNDTASLMQLSFWRHTHPTVRCKRCWLLKTPFYILSSLALVLIHARENWRIVTRRHVIRVMVFDAVARYAGSTAPFSRLVVPHMGSCAGGDICCSVVSRWGGVVPCCGPSGALPHVVLCPYTKSESESHPSDSAFSKRK